jgi:hypothetical protein
MSDRKRELETTNVAPWGRGDLVAVGTFLLALGVVLTYWFRHDRWLAEYDILSYFLPWYAHLGDRLRDGDLIPGWMPWLAGGAPFAGDPSGGWWYLPVMLAFPLLGAATAFKAMILVQSLVGGLATYALARLLGYRPIAALLSTVAYVLGPFLAGQIMFGTVAGQALAWIPAAFLGVECSLRSSRPVARVAWLGLAGLAVSQVAAAWPGQGLYNALLFIAGWVAYRSLLWPVQPGRSFRDRCLDALTTGPAVLGFGLLLGAAGLLPRLEASRHSNIPNGDYTGVPGGNYLATPHSLATLLRDTLVDDSHHRPVALAMPVVILAILAVLLVRRRSATPYFGAVVVLGSLLTMDETLLHRAFNLLPSFEVLHQHSPRRLIWVLFLAPAMLAGAGLDALLNWRPRRWGWTLLAVPLLLVGAATVVIDRHGAWIGWWPLVLAGVTTLLAAGIVFSWQSGAPAALPNLAALALVALAIVFPAVAAVVADARDTGDLEATAVACLPVALARTDPGGAGAFLQDQQDAEQPFRYVYDAGRDPATSDVSYSFRRCEPAVLAVLAGGRAAFLELQSIQGYNPLHLGVYTEYIDAMNGGPQDYHWTDPSPAALASSPLLDMLNVRYIVVALDGSTAPEAVAAGRREVFRDDQVVVYENPTAFSRAWVVHDVRPNEDGNGLAQLASGAVDGDEVAFVDGPLPVVEPLPGGSAGTVTITDWEPDSLTATVETQSAGLVVFSEIYAPGWVATVDGEPVEVLRTNHALRGVPVPEGTHTIELRYEPTSLRFGLWLSGVTGVVLAVVAAAAITQWVTARRG